MHQTGDRMVTMKQRQILHCVKIHVFLFMDFVSLTVVTPLHLRVFESQLKSVGVSLPYWKSSQPSRFCHFECFDHQHFNYINSWREVYSNFMMSELDDLIDVCLCRLGSVRIHFTDFFSSNLKKREKYPLIREKYLALYCWFEIKWICCEA